MPMKILHAASECVPLVKTGGLADVVGALPLAQRAQGDDARVILPAYRGLAAKCRELHTLATVAIRGRTLQLLRGRLDSGLPLYLVQCAALYEREGDPYRDAQGREFSDNAERFACFSEMVARLATGLDPEFTPQLAHLHDWQAGLAAAWLHEQLQRPRLLYTIHNLAYQGLFPRAQYEALQLPWRWWTPQGLEFWGQWSFAKAGLVYADALSTVSPSYAQEILGAEFGCGLQGVLQWRRGVLHGIVNGIDTQVWDPGTDPLLAQRYSLASVAAGKRANKRALQAQLGLAGNDAPLLVFIGRLTEQKGADLILAAGAALLASGAQLALLGAGDAALQDALRAWAARAPAGRVAVRIGYDETLAHQLYAGGDLLLMPSRFEPCGLNQLYAQRYGTVPVVRATGGLIDTVVDTTAETLQSQRAGGVQFRDADGAGLSYGVQRGLQLLREADTAQALRRLLMSRDCSWAASARQYRALYASL